MASITFTVANKTSTLEISDARFIEIARIIRDAELTDPDGQMTAQEQLDWFTLHVARMVRKRAIAMRRRELERNDEATIQTEFGEDWSTGS